MTELITGISSWFNSLHVISTDMLNYIFPIMVKYQKNSALTSITFIALVSVFFVCFSIVYFTKIIKINDAKPSFVIPTILYVISALLFVICMIVLPEHIVQLNNPEYFAIKELLSTLQ